MRQNRAAHSLSGDVASYRRHIMKKSCMKKRTSLGLFLIIISQVEGSYFVDVPGQNLFTPPDNYIFAVQLNQHLSFDVTGTCVFTIF
jgi:hypothetical protein